MSYIPNCREDENYNQKYLTGDDKEFVRGYDWCTEKVVDNFFDNFDSVDSDYLATYLEREVPDYMQVEYQMEDSFPHPGYEAGLESRRVKTYLDYIRYKLLLWVENSRDELITSMIDSMSDEEYEKAKGRADEGTVTRVEETEEHGNDLRPVGG